MQTFKRQLQVLTRNVRSLKQEDKMAKALMKMKPLKVYIVGVSEVKWPGTESLRSDVVLTYLEYLILGIEMELQ